MCESSVNNVAQLNCKVQCTTNNDRVQPVAGFEWLRSWTRSATRFQVAQHGREFVGGGSRSVSLVPCVQFGFSYGSQYTKWVARR